MALDNSQVEQQLNQMKEFILQEAREKAAEIIRKADEEASIEKGRIIRTEKAKIKSEFEKKTKQIEIQKKMYLVGLIPANLPLL